MATTSNRLTDLYREALESVTATPENWLRFLQSAGRNYRYPFQDQLLIHHQRPDAIAVLEFSQWERRFHRGIRRGSTGIAVFGRSNGRTQVRYLFDIQDTNERASSIPVPLWNVESGDYGPLLHMLEQKFSATEPVLPIAVMTTAKQYTSAVVSLRWEEVQKAQVPVTQDALERLVENSVAYLLLCRMGLEDYAIFYPQDFDALEQFRTPQNIHLLGDVVNMASRDILTEVAATVRAEHLGRPTFFAEESKTVYDEATEKMNPHEGGQTYDNDLPNRERLEPSESDSAPGDTRNREIRPDAGTVPDRTPAQPVPDPADQRHSEPAPDGGSEAGGGNAGTDHEESTHFGTAQAGEPHGVDRPDEQPEAQHRGDDLPDADYQLNIFGDTQEPEQSGSFVLPQAEIDQILRYGSITAGSRGRIFSFYQNHPSAADAAKFLKEEYGYSGHSYSFLDGSGGFVSYAPSTGLSIEHSESHTKTRLSWKSMEQRLRLMIREDTYLTLEEQMQYVSDHLEDSAETPEEPSRIDEMLQQAELAAELSQETRQNLFAFEAGNPEPVNLPHETVHATNFRITDDNLGCGSIRQKFANNLSAIRLLKSLEAEERNATPEEQEILSRYVGWGGMPQAFDPENTSWSSEYAQLKELLEDEEYKAARESVLNAHYTSPTVIRGIYEAIGRMGFTTGNILEPACGVGNFFGMLPDHMSGSRLYGVEMDSISGRIAKQLYPNADITVAGFETTDRRNFYDLGIGNVPFGNYLVDDKSYNSLGFRIHNYFFAKALDQVRPGGVVVFVTSRYTMDSKSTEVRKYLAQRAELLGAIRLPNNAFLANAGTSVVSDILFLQKRQRMVAMEPEWVHLDKTEDGITLNRYFVQHPEMVLGELSTESTQYGREECTVRPILGAVLSQQLHEAVQHICGTYVEMELDEAQDEQEDSIPADPNVKNYSFTVVDGTVYSPYTGAWQIEGRSVDSGSIYASSTYGTQRVSGYHILEDCLNLREVKVFDYVEVDGKRKAILNKKETAIAQGKQAEIKQAFQDWIWKDPDRRERLTTLYNERFNNLRPREYDGSHLIFPGMNPEITLRPHQKNAIARALYGGNTLLAHCVGAGKTFELVAIAQESKRLGLCHKSMVVVPNHLIGQWASEYLQLYPAANILVATEKDFTPARRKTFCSRISTGDYDAVIIGHSQFEKIPLSNERQTMLLERQIEDIVQGISEAKQAGGDRFTIKQMERSRKSIEVKLKKLNDQSRKDDVITFEELGVDRLLVDEAHLYKNLAAVSKMQNVAGISQTESQKASDMYLKCQYLDELTDEHGIVFATGTPISNSMVELYTMQRYLQSKTLEYYGFQHFDAWAANFGETVTAMELSPEGTGYRTKTRFARFYNLPELIYMFRLVADIQTAEMLKLPVPKANYHVEQLEPSELQRAMVKELSARADKVRNKMVDAAEDNMLKITSDGRKLALDQRLMNPMLPDDEHSKTAACAKNVYEIWEKTADQRGTQIVFCDLSTPHFDGSFNVYDDLRAKLTEMGIPKEEIAFIHEAPTDVKKKKLFQEVRSGQVRVLIGSTSKMGTGTNVQTRLAANHDLDCPWRPSDLEQRSGRIIRQGNLNDQVDIYRYVTKETFDSYNWQIIETKQRFISQIMVSKVPSRTMEEADEMTMSYAEIKALTTGNPLIKEKMDLDVAVSRLTLLRSSFLSQKYNLENQLHRYFPAEIQRLEQRILSLTDDLQQVKATATAEPGILSPMEIDGITYTEKKPAGTAILAACERKTTVEEAPLGSYRGFSMGLAFDSFQKEFQIILHRQLSYPVSLGNDALGNLQRIDNLLDGLEGRLTNAKRQLETTQEEMQTAKQEAEKEFPKEQELREKAARLQELNSLLNMDQQNSAILDAVTVEDVPEKEIPLTR